MATRTRSPRYPSHSLDEAIEYASKIYNGVHRSPIDAMTAYKLMGFAGKSGASATALGSIRQFGLIEGTGEGTRISDLALSILEPESELEKIRSIETAAFKPAVFQLIRERFEGRIPSVDEPIRAFLIRDLDFSKIGVDDCIKALRQTLDALPKVVEEPLTERSDRSDGERIEETFTPDLHSNGGKVSNQLFRIPLSKECVAEISFSGEVDELSIDRLIKHIDLMRDIWIED